MISCVFCDQNPQWPLFLLRAKQSPYRGLQSPHHWPVTPVTLTPTTLLLALCSSLPVLPAILWTCLAGSCPRAFALALLEPRMLFLLISLWCAPSTFLDLSSQVILPGRPFCLPYEGECLSRTAPPSLCPLPCYIFLHSIYHHLTCYVSHLLILIVINTLPPWNVSFVRAGILPASWPTVFPEPISSTWWVLSTYVPSKWMHELSVPTCK